MENLETLLCSTIWQHLVKNYRGCPSLEYLQKGTAVIRFKKEYVKKIKIFHMIGKYLLLRGIKLFNDNKPVENEDIPPFSSSSGSLYKNAQLNIRFNEIVKPYMLRTKTRRENCFVEIEFAKAVPIDQIVLYTGKEKKGIRDNTLAVEIVTEDNKKEVVYNYQKIINDQVAKVGGEVQVPGATFEQVCRTAEVMLHTYNESFKNIVAQLKALEKVGLDPVLVKEYLNDLLYPSKRQVTFGHGCRHTFNFWTDEEKKDYLVKANYVIDFLRREITPTVCYAYGTILGFIREKNYFIPHDYDLDVMLVVHKSDYRDYDDLEQTVIDCLKRNGVESIHIVRKYGGIFVKYQKSPRFDIYLCFEEDGLVERMGIYYKYSELEPPIPINILGIDCLIPSNPFAFLDKAFGRDWRIPRDIQTGELRETILRKTMPENFDKEAALKD